MAYFPQTNPAKRAVRVKFPGSVVVAIRSEGSQAVTGKLCDLSTTGGLLLLTKALEPGDFVEVAFETTPGIVCGMAELLAARDRSESGCLQPFRFVALDDADHTRLCMTLDSLQKGASAPPVKIG